MQQKGHVVDVHLTMYWSVDIKEWKQGIWCLAMCQYISTCVNYGQSHSSLSSTWSQMVKCSNEWMKNTFRTIPLISLFSFNALLFVQIVGQKYHTWCVCVRVDLSVTTSVRICMVLKLKVCAHFVSLGTSTSTLSAWHNVGVLIDGWVPFSYSQPDVCVCSYERVFKQAKPWTKCQQRVGLDYKERLSVIVSTCSWWY